MANENKSLTNGALSRKFIRKPYSPLHVNCDRPTTKMEFAFSIIAPKGFTSHTWRSMIGLLAVVCSVGEHGPNLIRI